VPLSELYVEPGLNIRDIDQEHVRDFRGLSGGSLLLTLRGMFFSYFSDTRELNTVAGKAIPA
ncbi:hypothetical protein ACQKFC_27495, partial [Raoultella planticola]